MASSSHMLNRVDLKSVENGEIIRSLTLQPVMTYITKVVFSVDCRAVFICGHQGNNNSNVIKLWLPYLDDTHEDNLTTLLEQENLNCYLESVSHDKTMIAIQDTVDRNKGWLLSLDNNYSCTVKKLNIQVSDGRVLFQFTPDDEYIIYATTGGLTYWNVANRKFTDNEYAFYNKRTMNNLKVVTCSPNNRHLIVWDDIEERDSSLYIMKFIFRNQNRKV